MNNIVVKTVKRHNMGNSNYLGVVALPKFFEDELMMIDADGKWEPTLPISQPNNIVIYLSKDMIGKEVKIKIDANKLIEYAKRVIENAYHKGNIKRRLDGGNS